MHIYLCIGVIFGGFYDGRVGAWKQRPPRDYTPTVVHTDCQYIPPIFSGSPPVNCLCVQGDKLIAGYDDGGICVWASMESGSLQSTPVIK
jgi:hypothetical protein